MKKAYEPITERSESLADLSYTMKEVLTRFGKMHNSEGDLILKELRKRRREEDKANKALANLDKIIV